MMLQLSNESEMVEIPENAGAIFRPTNNDSVRSANCNAGDRLCMAVETLKIETFG